MSAATSLTGAAARGSAATIFGQVVRMTLQMTATVVLARLLSPHDFGLIAMVTAVIGVAELVRDFGLSLASIQAKEISPAERTNLFWANTGLGAGSALIAVAATPVIVLIYHEPELSHLVPPLAGVFVLSGLTTQFRAQLLRDLRFGVVAVSDTLGPAAGIATAITLAALGAGYWALVAQQLVASATILLVVASSARWWPGLPRRDVSIRRFFRFGAGVFGSQALGYVTQNVDNVGIGAAWGSAALGLYSRAFQLVMVPIMQINAPLTNVVLPVLSRVHDDRERLGRGLRTAALVGAYVTAPVLAVSGALAVPLVHLLLGPAWAQVAPMLAILAAAGVFRSIAQVGYWGFLATGESGALFRLQLWVQPVSIAAILAGLPWGPIGVAYGVLAGTVLSWIAYLVRLQQIARVPAGPLFAVAVRAVGFFSGPTALVAATTSRVYHGADWATLLVSGGGAALTAVALAVAVPPVRRDLRRVVELVASAVRRPS